jgi:abelson tyrosine-protein kinase 1
VAAAAKAILGPSLDIAHELLAASVDVLQFAPVAGLSQAAKVLLNIWDSVALVDVSPPHFHST